VVLDATNLDFIKVENLFASIKSTFPDVEVEFNDQFLTTPLAVCLERDAKRANPIGEVVITKMYSDFKELIDRF
jgi:tRNA uridine 5-carbamoylmethylation protein Kti12